jgi:hypothetical protein
MIDVYYPYFLREASWDELRYSLRSLQKNLKEEFRVFIVGDLPEYIDPKKVTFIPHTRCEGMSENTVFDAISKILIYLNHPDAGRKFIRMYDDIYLLDKVNLKEIGKFKAMYDSDYLPERTGTWWLQLYRTIRIVKWKGYHGWNTETHFPELFEREKMLWIISVYDALEKRLLTSTLYYNVFFVNSKPVLYHDCKGIQFFNNEDNEFYTSSTGDLKKKCKGKLYLNHNDAGLNDNLKAFLMNSFPKKSRFEK